jgi:hypothetical protein
MSQLPRVSAGLFDSAIPAVAPQANDALRTPHEIMGPQLPGYHLSLRIGLNPDNPGRDGVTNRVVPGVTIHRDSSFVEALHSGRSVPASG